MKNNYDKILNTETAVEDHNIYIEPHDDTQGEKKRKKEKILVAIICMMKNSHVSCVYKDLMVIMTARNII